MDITISIADGNKHQWNEGLLAILDINGTLSCGPARYADAPALKAGLDFFDQANSQGIIAVEGSGKKLRAFGVFSTSQVKYLSEPNKLRTLASRVYQAAEKARLDKITIPAENLQVEDIECLLQGLTAAAYRFEKYKSAAKSRKKLTVTILVKSARLKSAQEVLKQELSLEAAVSFARDLVNEIPEELFPTKLAELAKAATKGTSLTTTIYDVKRLQKEQFNGILGVGKGSKTPPCLMVFRHEAKKKSPIHLCLVGKAVTFDTGGHSLKPAKSMWEMKGDMAGGAAVIGAMLAIARLNPNITVTGIVPSAQNAIGPNAILPGDIIRSRSGKTVHVDNTDAEGRLILMDALNLAQELKATHIVDVATLTGSIVRALGEAMAGLFANADDWAETIRTAGEGVGEDYWRMPLIAEYRRELDHPVADLDNVGKSINAGAITAALFLQEFVSDEVKWAHLDIAAVGLYTKSYKQFGPGGSGFGVRTLTQLALSLAERG